MNVTKQLELAKTLFENFSRHENPENPVWFTELFQSLVETQNELESKLKHHSSLTTIGISYHDTEGTYTSVPIQDWVNNDIVNGDTKLLLPSRLTIIINHPFSKVIRSHHFSVNGWTLKKLHKKVGNIFYKHQDLLGGADSLDGILINGFTYDSKTHILTVKID
jgi:hypothetical protein